MKKRTDWKFLNLIVISFLALHGGLLAGYLNNLFNGYVYIALLLVSLVLTLVIVLKVRNDRSKLRALYIVAVAQILLLAFEYQLLEFERYTFLVSQYADPVEVVEDSGIHLMIVSTFEVFYLTDEATLREEFSQEDMGVIELYEVTNAQRYFSKNEELARNLRLDTDEFDVMTEAVTTYLTDPSDSVREFMDTTIITGNSMGLALVLSDLLSEQGVKNEREIGVTGALDDNGAVRGIGMVKEKVLIAAENGFPFMLVPTENLADAIATKERENLAIDIHAVESVEEAVAYIESINQN